MRGWVSAGGLSHGESLRHPSVDRGSPEPGGGHRQHPPDLLSAREQQIVGLVARGSTNAEIARELVISAGTVANHVERLLVRLSLPSRAALAAWAVERDLLEVHERHLAALERLVQIHATSLTAVMDRAAPVLAEALAIEKVDLFVHDPEQASLVVVETVETPVRRRQRTLGLNRLPLEQGGRIVDVFRIGMPYVAGRADRDPEVREGFTRGLGLHSVVAVPVEVAGVRRGVLLLQARRAEAFTAQDLRFVRTVACWLGGVVEQAEVVEGPPRGRRPAAGIARAP